MVSPQDLENLRNFIKRNGVLSLVALILIIFGAVYFSGAVVGFLEALARHEAQA